MALIKYGKEADLPELKTGEPAFTTDTKKFFIGDTLINGGESAGDQTYIHTQSVPESVWTITLPEGFKEFPAVTIIDSSGRQVLGQVDYTYPVVTLTFGGAFSGKASFS